MAKHFIYKADSLSTGGMFVHNNNNHYHAEGARKNSVTGDDLERSDNYSLLKVFKKTFSNERLKQLQGETLVMELFMSNEGKILEVSFILHKNTLLTVTELETLETAVKTDVSFKWNGRSGKPGEIFELYQPVSFRKILDGTFPG